MKLENIMLSSLILYIILSFILAIFVLMARNPATVVQDIALSLVNILTGATGIYRMKKYKRKYIRCNK
ncbi:MAG: hypothetical protein ACP5U0_10435 [Caldisphaera sp.]